MEWTAIEGSEVISNKLREPDRRINAEVRRADENESNMTAAGQRND